MASDYSRFSKGINNEFKNISRDNKIEKVYKVKDEIQSIIKSFTDTLSNTDFELRGSEFRKLLSSNFNVTEGHLMALATHTKNYTDDFVRYTKRENNPTVLTVFIGLLVGLYIISSFLWLIFNSSSLFGFFVNFIIQVLIAIVVGILINYFGGNWLLFDSIKRLKIKSLKELRIIQDNSNLIIEKLGSVSVDTSLLAENLQDLSDTTESFFNI